jgi:PPOX class probable FMN-dependent enzyme
VVVKLLDSVEALSEYYGEAVPASLWKEIDHLNEHYQKFVQHSPFLVLATCGSRGMDCSPRGDPPGFVRVVDPKTILVPDRRGNNRIDSLRNIVENPQVGLIFLIPNVGEVLRIAGRASIVVDAELNESFAIQGKPSKSVIRVEVDKAYYQCQKSIARSGLWRAESHIERSLLPTAGQMAKEFAAMQNIKFDAEAYDRNYPEHLKKTIY